MTTMIKHIYILIILIILFNCRNESNTEKVYNLENEEIEPGALILSNKYEGNRNKNKDTIDKYRNYQIKKIDKQINFIDSIKVDNHSINYQVIKIDSIINEKLNNFKLQKLFSKTEFPKYYDTIIIKNDFKFKIVNVGLDTYKAYYIQNELIKLDYKTKYYNYTGAVSLEYFFNTDSLIYIREYRNECCVDAIRSIILSNYYISNNKIVDSYRVKQWTLDSTEIKENPEIYNEEYYDLDKDPEYAENLDIDKYQFVDKSNVYKIENRFAQYILDTKEHIDVINTNGFYKGYFNYIFDISYYNSDIENTVNEKNISITTEDKENVVFYYENSDSKFDEFIRSDSARTKLIKFYWKGHVERPTSSEPYKIKVYDRIEID